MGKEGRRENKAMAEWQELRWAGDLKQGEEKQDVRLENLETG